jgi:hypothetical protein
MTCTGSVADANDDGTFTGKCTDGTARTFTFLSGPPEQVKVSYPPPSGTICPRTGCFIVFNRA